MHTLDALDAKSLRHDIPDFRPGDTLKVHVRVVEEVTAAASALGLTRIAMTESPITGTEGNREFLLHLRHD